MESRHVYHPPHVHVDGGGGRAKRPTVLPPNPTPPCERTSTTLWLTTHSQEACERQMSGRSGLSAGGAPPPRAYATGTRSPTPYFDHVQFWKFAHIGVAKAGLCEFVSWF
eukprot:351675-Chlamydomonas_euryale.AAC.8